MIMIMIVMIPTSTNAARAEVCHLRSRNARDHLSLRARMPEKRSRRHLPNPPRHGFCRGELWEMGWMWRAHLVTVGSSRG